MSMTASRLLFLCALAASPCLTQAAEYGRLLPERSSLVFVSKQMGVPVEGQFKRFGVDFSFDPARPEAAKAVVEIDLASVDAGSRDANEELAGKNWFHVRRHPAARFVATSARRLGGNRYELRGPLTLKGRTREVAAPFTWRDEGTLGVFEGGFVLKRLDFGIGEGAWGDTGVVADEVQIRFLIRSAEVPAGSKK